MKVGHPPIFSSAEDLRNKIEEYFETGVKKRQVEVGRGESKQVIEIPVPTITGLVLFCGFDSRQSFYDYEKREGFSYTIKRARTFIECEYEEQIALGSTAAIFALKNFGWTDKIVTEEVGSLNHTEMSLDTFREERKRMLEEDDC